MRFMSESMSTKSIAMLLSDSTSEPQRVRHTLFGGWIDFDDIDWLPCQDKEAFEQNLAEGIEQFSMRLCGYRWEGCKKKENHE